MQGPHGVPRIALIALPSLTLAGFIGTLVGLSRGAELVRSGSQYATFDMLLLVWLLAPMTAMLLLAIVVISKPPTTWRRLLPIQAVFLILTALGVWSTLLEPDRSSTAGLGIVGLPVVQWALLILALVLLLVGSKNLRAGRQRSDREPGGSSSEEI